MFRPFSSTYRTKAVRVSCIAWKARVARKNTQKPRESERKQHEHRRRQVGGRRGFRCRAGAECHRLAGEDQVPDCGGQDERKDLAQRATETEAELVPQARRAQPRGPVR